jgi:amidase
VNATVVDRLEMAGAVVLGKLTMTEGAFGAHHPQMPKPKNPWNTDFWTGVSSSGSGAATAAGFCFGSLGSDTAGSIRYPTACCGLSGMKATWGRVSRHGVCDLAESLDHLGPMTRTVADSAAILGVIAGADPNDPTAARVPVPDYLALLDGGIRGLRIGLCESYVFDTTHPDVSAVIRNALEVFEALGAEIVPLEFPDVSEMGALVIPLFAAEAAIAHDATYPARKADYGPELGAFIEAGHRVTGLQLGKAHIYRDQFKGQMAALLGSVDAMICPAIPAQVPSSAELDAAMATGEFGSFLTFTLPFNFSGNPSLNLQGGFDSNGLPIGFQLIGKAFTEELLFKAGHTFQTVTDWHTRNPVL